MADAAALRLSQDARELQRGVAVTYLGYALKLGFPVLVAFATRAYGPAAWGRFVTAQALVLVAARLSLLGLDKTLLWAVPTRERREVAALVPPALLRVTLHAFALTLGAQLWFRLAAGALAREYESLRVASWALVPFVASELLLHATMGLRRMELHVAVRETLNPTLQVALALALFKAGWHEQGLAWAYVGSQSVGLFVSVWGYARWFGLAGARGHLRLAPELMRYALPLWLSEITNALLLRLDTLALAALAPPKVVGVWGVVSQFANALRQMRRAYDPVVIAITARIAAQRDSARLSEAFSYAAQMVSLTQLPVFAGLVCFSDLLLPLYGADFGEGAPALKILAVFFLLSGGSGLAGLVVSGYGKSHWTLVNTLLNALVQGALLWLLVPRFGLEGAAVATGTALCAVNGVQLWQMKLVTGSVHFTPRSRFSLLIVVSSALGLALGVAFARAAAPSEAWVRASGALSFALIYLALCARGFSTGILRAPREAA